MDSANSLLFVPDHQSKNCGESEAATGRAGEIRDHGRTDKERMKFLD